MSPTWPRSFAARTAPTPGISCNVVADAARASRVCASLLLMPASMRRRSVSSSLASSGLSASVAVAGLMVRGAAAALSALRPVSTLP